MMFEFINKILPNQKRELHNGNREYKMYLDLDELESKKDKKILIGKSKAFIHYLREQKLTNKINRRASQLHFRLEEGHGKALYILGIKDNGTTEGINIEMMFKSLNFLYKMVDIINAKIKNIRIYKGLKDNTYVCTIRIENPNYTPKQLHTI